MTNVQNPWARHYQAAWHDDAVNPRYPYPLRVAFLAFGAHKANGHAMFKAGEIRKVLVHVDDATGEVIYPAYETVTRAIKSAIDFGLLDPRSTTRCLVVPAHRIGGGLGDPDQLCPQHSKTRRQPAKATHLKVVNG